MGLMNERGVQWFRYLKEQLIATVLAGEFNSEMFMQTRFTVRWICADETCEQLHHEEGDLAECLDAAATMLQLGLPSVTIENVAYTILNSMDEATEEDLEAARHDPEKVWPA